MINLTIQRKMWSPVECITSAEELNKVFNDPESERKVSQIRQYLFAGDKNNAQKVKETLPGLIFVADDFDVTEKLVPVWENGEKKEVLQKAKWRFQTSAHLNGLAVLDSDHLKERPEQIFARWTPEQLEELGIYLIFKTSSDEGLKVVFKARQEWGNLIDNALAMGKLLNLPVDKSCKDASRMSFAPSALAGDILYYNPEGLFGCENADYDKLFGEVYRQGDSSSKKEKSEPVVRNSEIRDFVMSDCKYKGVEMQKIVDCWIGDEKPQEGERHKTSLCLADELRYITDSDPVMIEGILRAQPWVDEIVKERGENVAQTVKSAMAFKEENRIPKRMYHALVDAGVDLLSGISKSKLPYQEWYERMKKIRLGCYKPVVDYIEGDLIKMGGIILSSGMYGTLLTNCWYQDWEGNPHRLNCYDFEIGKPASGKGAAAKLDEYIMDVMLKEDKEGRAEERMYKEGLSERETSQKEQEKEALKRPKKMVRYCPVKTSNNVFYRRMLNAQVTLPNGEVFGRHLYTFASELLSVVKASGNFQEKRDIMLQAFHNETNGVDYANKDSVNEVMPMCFNMVATGTSVALDKFVNPGNIGDGLSTRLTCFLMPDLQFKMRPYCAKAKSMKNPNEMKQWGVTFNGMEGEIKGVGKLTRHIYNLIAARAEEADNCGDEATVTMCMRLQDKVMAVCIPHVLSTQKSLEEVQRTMTVTITKQHLDFATLMFDVISSNEEVLFGQMLQDFLVNEKRDKKIRNTYDKTAKFYKLLPDTFTTQNVKEIWGFSTISTASNKCNLFEEQKIIQKIAQGKYRKLVSAI